MVGQTGLSMLSLPPNKLRHPTSPQPGFRPIGWGTSGVAAGERRRWTAWRLSAFVTEIGSPPSILAETLRRAARPLAAAVLVCNVACSKPAPLRSPGPQASRPTSEFDRFNKE